MNRHERPKKITIDPNSVSIDRAAIKVRNLGYSATNTGPFFRLCNAFIDCGAVRTKQTLTRFEFTFKDLHGVRSRGSATLSLKHQKISVDLFLALNPTRRARAIVQQRFEQEFPRSLDNNDNFLPAGSLIRPISRSTSAGFKNVLWDDISAILKWVDDVVASTENSELVKTSEPSVYLSEIELYWDVEIDDAVRVAADLSSPVAQYYKRSKVVEYPPKATANTLESNAIGVQVETSTGERLQIYSKTKDLLRIEVCMNGERIRYIAGSNIVADRKRLGVLLYDLLSRRFSGLESLLRSVITPTASDGSILDDLYHTIAGCKTPSEFKDILSLLVSAGGLRASSELNNVRQRLRRRRVLNKGDRGVFILRPGFQLFLGKLQDLLAKSLDPYKRI